MPGQMTPDAIGSVAERRWESVSSHRNVFSGEKIAKAAQVAKERKNV